MKKAIGILLSEASAPIRWRVEREILEREPKTVSKDELLAYPRVRENLDYLTGETDFNSIHGSTERAFENACGILYDMGVRSGAKELDERIKPYLDFLEALDDDTDDRYLHTSFLGREFSASLIAGSVSALGYNGHPAVRKHVEARLERLSEFGPRFDPATLYAPDPPGYPKVWRMKTPFLNPEHYTGKRFHLQWVWNVNSLGSLPEALVRNAEEVVGWIMTDEYQSLRWGYGVVAITPRRYCAMGWSMKLPGWNGDFDAECLGYLPRYMETLAVFESATSHPWFKKALAWLAGFVDADGLCRIPRESLMGKGNWILGRLGAAELSPRTYRKRVLEATARLMLVENKLT